MTSLLPPRFLFRYSLPVRQRDTLPLRGKRLLDLPAECTLPDFAALDGGNHTGELRLAWNQEGLGISVQVRGKKRPIECAERFGDANEGLQVWIDTRNTQSIHRASRFCHHFCLIPKGSGKSSQEPFAIQLPIARAREETPRANTGEILLAAEVARDGYLLEAWLPASVLHGYDPAANPRLGFYYFLRDRELGDQYLTVGPEFPFTYDPSLWATLELVP